MTANNRDYIYAFDVNNQKIITINAETGEQITPPDSEVYAILNFLQKQGRPIKLREFTIWCAHQTNPSIKPLQRKFFELAYRAIQNDAENVELHQLYASTEREAVAIDSVGLRQGSAPAAGFLMSRECINPDAMQGAKNAARFHYLWAQMNGKMDERSAFMPEIDLHIAKNIIDETQAAQINYLLDLIGNDL